MQREWPQAVPFVLYIPMSPALILFLKIGILFSLCSVILGLIRPVFVLWFLDRFNRIKVIRLYGTIFLLLLVLLLLLQKIIL
jgi:hypothetical protein